MIFNRSQYHIEVEPIKEKGYRQLYDYQIEAINRLNEIEEKKKEEGFAGLLVLPTGAGKTFTAARWVLSSYINKGYKVLWIAHRHELLNQAAETFIKASNIETLPDREQYSVRIISGVHGRSVTLEEADDLVIASKDSVNAGFKYYEENWLTDGDKLLIVVDEAHHAVAKTYRKIIDRLSQRVKVLSLLGLTATPVRTAEKERGYLKLVFKDDIIYKVDMRTLIARGILSEPIFEEVNTKIDMSKKFTESEIKKIIKYDFDRLPMQSLNSIAQNAKRNKIIVSTYLNNKEKYKQTIVFALNISNAIALNKLFNKNGVKCDYVVSGLQDSMTKVTISPEHNARILEAFKKGEIEVLINVNILTEGTDIPNVQTIFLARPTMSPILITQMIGRGLRGVKAGGTPQAYIVGFVDDWKGRIDFISPEKLIENEEEFIPDTITVSPKRVLNMVSIRLLEMFTQAIDNSIGSIEQQGIMAYIPVGCYSFDYRCNGKMKKCDILVYNNSAKMYEQFLDNIDSAKTKAEIINHLSNENNDRMDLLRQDFKDMFCYYEITGNKPEYTPFVERNKYDITELAQQMYELKLEEGKKIKHLKQLWNNNKYQYKAFWGSNNFDAFCIAIDYEIGRLNRKQKEDKPKVTIKIPEKEKMDLNELKKYHPKYYYELKEYVYTKYKDEEGYYFSAQLDEEGNRFKSKHKVYFQIDHIKPISKGGLSVKENLQLLSRYENISIGNRK